MCNETNTYLEVYRSLTEEQACERTFVDAHPAALCFTADTNRLVFGGKACFADRSVYYCEIDGLAEHRSLAAIKRNCGTYRVVDHDNNFSASLIQYLVNYGRKVVQIYVHYQEEGAVYEVRTCSVNDENVGGVFGPWQLVNRTIEGMAIDSHLDETSANAVQNAAVTKEIREFEQHVEDELGNAAAEMAGAIYTVGKEVEKARTATQMATASGEQAMSCAKYATEKAGEAAMAAHDADEAAKAATTASNMAKSASQQANTAAGYAQGAYLDAMTALVNVNKAADEAKSATEAANAATAANNAIAAEMTAKANQAAADASEAKQAAQSAVEAELHEAERVEAEAKREAAEEQRLANEVHREDNETARESAESKREEAEDIRYTQEDIRQSNEFARKNAEKERELAEYRRKQNETYRQERETVREESANMLNAAITASQTATQNANAATVNANAAADEARRAVENLDTNIFRPVTSLPLISEAEDGLIYLLPVADIAEEGNLFDEFVVVNGKWERFGTGRIDLSEYAKCVILEPGDFDKQLVPINILADNATGVMGEIKNVVIRELGYACVARFKDVVTAEGTGTVYAIQLQAAQTIGAWYLQDTMVVASIGGESKEYTPGTEMYKLFAEPIDKAFAGEGMTPDEREKLTALDQKVGHINGVMGPYTEREPITLTLQENGKAINRAGVKVNKAGWAICSFVGKKGDVYSFNPGVMDGDVCIFSEEITKQESRPIEYKYTYDEEGLPLSASATYNGAIHSYTWQYERDEEGNIISETITDDQTGAQVNALPYQYQAEVGTYHPLTILNESAELPIDKHCRLISHFQGEGTIRVTVSFNVASADMNLLVFRDGLIANLATQLGTIFQMISETNKALALVEQLAAENAELIAYIRQTTDNADFGSLPTLCGQPMTLFGAGTPQEAIVPENWKQYDPVTGEGYQWNGMPSALGQVYINTSVSTNGRYTAVPNGFGNLKWVNF